MSSEDREIYIMREAEGDEWVSPTPARTAIADAIVEATDLDEDDLDLEDAVDFEDVRAVLSGEGDDALSFEIEGHEIEVTSDGEIDVAD